MPQQTNFVGKKAIAERVNFLVNESLQLMAERDGEGNIKIDKAGIEKVRANEVELGPLQADLAEIQQLEVAEENAKRLKEQVNVPEKKMQFPGAKTEQSEIDHPAPKTSRKSIGKTFVESDGYLKYNEAAKTGPEVEFELKTLFDEASGYAPQAIRIPYISDFPTRPIAVIDIIPQGTTDQVAVVYMEETTYTNNAAEKAEAAAYAESAFAFTERTNTVRKITNSLPITDEMRQDAPQIESYVNNRLLFQVRQRLDSQLINGDGIAPNLLGILNVSGIQTQATAADPEADAVHKAITKVAAVGFSQATAVILHPNNWQKIHLMKTSTGEYMYGAPWEPGPGTLWGLPVVSTTAITAGTGLVGAYTPFSQFFTKKALSMMMGYNNDDFTKGKMTIRADMRGAMVTYRPLAFCSVTGMGS